ncbi:hypothetical protein LWC34_26595 [Kibdelosporangium philippinense]|uniref:Uncharacterized protein n=1 Tax=Kibdelosporangium philippinense TaxID=211113 RepID=A0ABS8ZF03_9PSEU|nr:hypothetical protein [Kibdelosporangium philippinense]MCE7006376.1 hypothetical protein [Kibdelosporangium philippinense]
MPLLTRHTDSSDADLAKHVVGNALVIYPAGRMTRETQELALAVAADEEHDLVVVDLPAGSPITMWEAVATALPRRGRGVRLVIGGRSRETTALAGHWLAQRLGRTVLAPDGPVIRGAGGSLFVHAGQSSGWVRFHPGRPPRWEAKRFPRPSWDSTVMSENFPTSARGIAEPLPGGVWIRPAGDDPLLQHNRMQIIEAMPCQQDVIGVVLGSPGGIPLNMDDIVRFWRELPDGTKAKLRFIHYGPMSIPRGAVLGQMIADVLKHEIVCYTGMPTGVAAEPDIRTVVGDGTFGWYSFARELAYRPAKDGEEAPAPRIISHRLPVAGAQEVAPEVYWYSIDAVVEVVQSGLLLRPPTPTPHTDAIRAIPLDPGTHNLTYDAVDDRDLERMRYLAEDLQQRLDKTTRLVSRIVHAVESIGAQSAVRPVGIAQQQIEPSTTVDWFAGELEQEATAEPVGGIGYEAEVTSVLWPSPRPRRPAIPAATAAPIRLESSPTPGPASMGPASTGAGSMAPQLPDLPAVAAVAAPDGPLDSAAVSAATGSTVEEVPVESLELSVPAVVSVELPDLPVEQAGSEIQETSAPAKERADARIQPVPEPEASALLAKRGIDDERAWLRRTLASEFGTMSTAVARVLSQHPGFQGALSRSSAQVLTDAVAVQLYLSGHGEDVDRALRTGAVGPHVPFARCVVAGLSRLPSHRGPAVFTTSPSEQELDLYRNRKLITEWGFLHALVGPCAEQQGTTDVLVWSMTARRTKLLEASENGVADRVLFVPGTSFKVLEITEADESGRGRVLLRELTAVEIDEDGRVDQNRVSLDELALNSLHRQVDKWAGTGPVTRVGPAAAHRFGALPGLLVD